MPTKITIEELRRTEEFQRLTAKQARLVEVYLETGSRLKAVQAGYKCKSEQSAKVMSYSVFAKPAITAALAVANGENAGLVAFQKTVERAIQNPRLTIAQSSALKLYAQLHGYLKSAPELEAPVAVVGFEGPVESVTDTYVALPDAPAPRRATELEFEAASIGSYDNPHAPHNAMIRRDEFCRLLQWRQNAQTASTAINYWTDEKESKYQAARQVEREHWKTFATRELPLLWTYPVVGQQWDPAILALAVNELGLKLS